MHVLPLPQNHINYAATVNASDGCGEENVRSHAMKKQEETPDMLYLTTSGSEVDRNEAVKPILKTYHIIPTSQQSANMLYSQSCIHRGAYRMGIFAVWRLVAVFRFRINYTWLYGLISSDDSVFNLFEEMTIHSLSMPMYS
ncbi:Uncharacterized protein Fot_23309 [Forsythia ovata]|uniref:Uncharacterized protein n=1 Tax=Forsythia ovata TaxID=205694 RepID=A0ABD1V165_9LAMI